MKLIGITAKPNDGQAASLANDLRGWLKKRDCTVWMDDNLVPNAPDSMGLESMPQHVELMVVLGGDGTLLHTARHFIGSKVPILGINLGRLGFLTDTPVGSMFDVMNDILLGRCKTKQYFSLHAEARRDGRRIYSGWAINDVVIQRGAHPRMIEFEMMIRDQFVFRMRGDGLILATPAGSTAYALSAGGAIIHPEVEAIGVVPICPHTLSNRPIVVPATDCIELQLVGVPGSAALNLDGQGHMELDEGDRICVRRGPVVSLIYLPQRHYFEVLRTKLHWAGHLEVK